MKFKALFVSMCVSTIGVSALAADQCESHSFKTEITTIKNISDKVTSIRIFSGDIDSGELGKVYDQLATEAATLDQWVHLCYKSLTVEQLKVMFPFQADLKDYMVTMNDTRLDQAHRPNNDALNVVEEGLNAIWKSGSTRAVRKETKKFSKSAETAAKSF